MFQAQIFNFQTPQNREEIAEIFTLGGIFMDLLDILGPYGGYSHLDRVFLTVVNKGNILIVLLDAINSHTRLVNPSARL